MVHLTGSTDAFAGVNPYAMASILTTGLNKRMHQHLRIAHQTSHAPASLVK
jgi:hypothetical protein